MVLGGVGGPLSGASSAVSAASAPCGPGALVTTPAVVCASVRSAVMAGSKLWDGSFGPCSCAGGLCSSVGVTGVGPRDGSPLASPLGVCQEEVAHVTCDQPADCQEDDAPCVSHQPVCHDGVVCCASRSSRAWALCASSPAVLRRLPSGRWRARGCSLGCARLGIMAERGCVRVTYGAGAQVQCDSLDGWGPRLWLHRTRRRSPDRT